MTFSLDFTLYEGRTIRVPTLFFLSGSGVAYWCLSFGVGKEGRGWKGWKRLLRKVCM